LNIQFDLKKYPELKSILSRIDGVLETDPQEAVNILSSALLLALPIDDQELFSVLYSYLGASNLVLLNPVAIRNYEAALDAADQCQRLDLKIEALHGLGITFLRFGELNSSLEYSEKAMNLARAENVANLIPKILVTLGVAFLHTHQFQRGTVFLQESVESATILGDQLSIAKAKNTWADTLINWYIDELETKNLRHPEYLDLSVKLATESKQIAREINAVRTELMVSETLAHALECRGDYQDAMDSLNYAKNNLDGHGFIKEMLDIDLRMGELLTQVGKIDESIAVLIATRNKAKKLLNYHSLADLLKGLCHAYELKNDYRSALEVMKDVHSTVMKQRDYRSQISAQIYAAKMDLERAQKEAEDHKKKVSVLENYNISLQAQANEDPLTSLPNRRSLEDYMKRRFDSSTSSMTFVMCDIDFFKKVNDNFSHLIGDDVLRDVGKLIRDSLRPNDFAARIGGEEFAIILDQCKEEHMIVTCDRIRKIIERYDWSKVSPKLRITMSFGVTYYHHGDNLLSLMSRSDTALYAAKNNGRNRVEKN
jgi:diguanylate cyclase (GGDEF)-like protein